MAWVKDVTGMIGIRAQDNSAWGATPLRLTKPGTKVEGKGQCMASGLLLSAIAGTPRPVVRWRRRGRSTI